MVSFEREHRFELDRRHMIQTDLQGRDITDPRALEVFATLPREEFVSPEYAGQAYADYPIPIGLGQTISQPYIVALMTQCLELTGSQTVLEIGTGSGYQTAVLAQLCKKVYTIERFSELSERARTILARLGIRNVEYAVSDGSCGWPQAKEPFDRIILTAAIPEVPGPLESQLAEDGLLVAPVGNSWSQTLMVFHKKHGRLESNAICGCRFVKLIGQYGFKETED